MPDHLLLLLWPYALTAALICSVYLWLHRRRDRRSEAVHATSVREGLDEPPSLHPVIDPGRCVGSGGCALACPEKALGVVGGKAMLIHPAACIGHGACRSACPVDAIALVFGTERRGIDIPDLSPDFETNVAGIFVAGELGGMGLIRKATEQGRQAIEAIRRRPRGRATVDVVIVGAGPAGLSAGLAALRAGLSYCLIEQESSLGGAIFHYPRQKLTMAHTLELAGVGRIKAGTIRKEALLELWQDIVHRTGLDLHFGEQLLGIEPRGETFDVVTSRRRIQAGSVLLAIGRRGTPRRLDVPGEELAKVVYRLVDPQQYDGQHVLVVGGGDAALEAAAALAGLAASTTLSYRGKAFARAKARNREAVKAAQDSGQLRVWLESEVVRIEPHTVDLRCGPQSQRLPNEAVIVCAGGELPTPMLKAIGVHVETKHGTA